LAPPEIARAAGVSYVEETPTQTMEPDGRNKVFEDATDNGGWSVLHGPHVMTSQLAQQSLGTYENARVPLDDVKSSYRHGDGGFDASDTDGSRPPVHMNTRSNSERRDATQHRSPQQSMAAIPSLTDAQTQHSQHSQQRRRRIGRIGRPS